MHCLISRRSSWKIPMFDNKYLKLSKLESSEIVDGFDPVKVGYRQKHELAQYLT